MRALARRKLRSLGWARLTDVGFDPAFLPIHARCKPYTMTSAQRMQALYDAATYVVRARMPGAFVECGVWRGGSAMVAAIRFAELGDPRHMWLYDTFAGMTRPGEHDTPREHEKWRALQREDHNEWCLATRPEVEANMLSVGVDPERLHLVEGKVEDTLPERAPNSIAILRLDTDWYESTRHELEHLYPLVVPGGVLIVDDYGDHAGAQRAVDEFFADRPVLLSRLDHTGRIAVKV